MHVADIATSAGPHIRASAGRGLTARVATDAADLAAALALRARAFRGGAPDRDGFDAPRSGFRHILVAEGGRATGTFRWRSTAGADLLAGYAARRFDLARLVPRGPHLEIGRLCALPGSDPRALAGPLAALVLASGARTVLGCAALPGADPARHGPALAALAGQGGQHALPPLLRLYLALGARAAPRPVPDPELDTLLLLFRLDTARIPAPRRRSLRALAAAIPVIGLPPAATSA